MLPLNQMSVTYLRLPGEPIIPSTLSIIDNPILLELNNDTTDKLDKFCS
jgi:hypothetical protein